MSWRLWDRRRKDGKELKFLGKKGTKRSYKKIGKSKQEEENKVERGKRSREKETSEATTKKKSRTWNWKEEEKWKLDLILKSISCVILPDLLHSQNRIWTENNNRNLWSSSTLLLNILGETGQSLNFPLLSNL